MKALRQPLEDDDMKRVARMLRATEVPAVDYTARVMIKIQSSPSSIKPCNRRYIGLIAVLVCAVGLITGFSYQIIEKLNLKDGEGKNAVEIVKASGEHTYPKDYDLVLNEVRQKLAQGETATVFFGSKEEILSGNAKYDFGTIRPFEFTSLEALYKELPVSYKTVPQPPKEVRGFKLTNAFLVPLPGRPSSTEYIFGKHALTGIEYGYLTGKSVAGVNAINFQYQKDDLVITYVLKIDDMSFSYAVNQPDKKDIRTILGVETYWVQDNEKKGTLLWSKYINGLVAKHTLLSSTASKEEIISFAEELLSEQ
ncbi:hypothetical protein [Paenibacillus contaminans]|uniref:DUF4367 domain-containing protein n=1 Tax=Paenibacillus contaminans TaxID=450362 RepID=A0A329LPV3_9BACL|nr:hypothetical protein [Paenibacillus contaminans]RAV08713.1 hypothetical protein DQG23_40570 [Paenibacillus contaminans]